MGLFDSLFKKDDSLSASERSELEKYKEEEERILKEKRDLKRKEEMEKLKLIEKEKNIMQTENEYYNSEKEEYSYDGPISYQKHNDSPEWFFSPEAESEFNHIDNMVFRTDFIYRYLLCLKNDLEKTLTFKIALIIADGMYNSGIESYSSLRFLLNQNTNPLIRVLINGELDNLSTNEIINKLLCALHNKTGVFKFKDLTQLNTENVSSALGMYTIEREIIWYLSDTIDSKTGLGPYDFFGPGSGVNLDNSFDSNINNGNNTETNNTLDDSLYGEAVEFVASTRRASTSSLQRRFGIGYNRAATLIDEMEKNGIIGPSNGSKPRDVYVSGSGHSSKIKKAPWEVSISNLSNVVKNENSSSGTYKSDSPFLIKLTDAELGGNGNVK